MKSFLGFTYVGDGEKPESGRPRFLQGGWAILVVVLLIALAVMWYAERGFYRDNSVSGDPIRSPRSGRAWIEVDFGDGTKRLFEGDVDGKSYPLDAALGSAAREGGFTVKLREGAVAELAGIKNAHDKWVVYRNGEKLEPASIENLTIADGDRYTFRYE